MTEDLKIIKRLYGEAMMHFCRDVFSSILEEKGILPKLLQDNFAVSHVLYDDLLYNDILADFKYYIYGLLSKDNEMIADLSLLHPQELLRQAGYFLYECKSEDDIQKFKKYYAKGEELCTFRGGRLYSCYVFFAVKENVDEINRADFDDPSRQDLYGTSVISIQFSRDSSHILSIKNRYNHRVNNPDATFGNNLDNIIEGLTESFEEFYGLKQEYINDGFEIPGYVRANDGKWYKYNYEMDNIYYCPDNIIIDNGEVKKYPKEKYIIMDYFILDLEKKQIYLYKAAVEESMQNVIDEIERISIVRKENVKKVEIISNKNEKFVFTLDKENKIIGLASQDIIKAENDFLSYNKVLEFLDLPNLQQVGDFFLFSNEELSNLNLPSLQQVGNEFLYHNKFLNSLFLPTLQNAGNDFFCWNMGLSNLNLPNLRQAGSNFFYNNEIFTSLCLPNLQRLGNNFLYKNRVLTNLGLPSLQIVGDSFLYSNRELVSLDLPSLHVVGDSFLNDNVYLSNLNAPNLKRTGYKFLWGNRKLNVLNSPKLQYLEGDYFIFNRAMRDYVAKLIKKNQEIEEVDKGVIIHARRIKTN